MKNLAIALLLLALAGILPAHANPGENRAALARRFGEPTTQGNPPDPDVSIYHTPDYEIRVDFEKGKSVSEIFRRLGEDKAFSEEAIQAILHAQSAGKTWLEVPHPEEGRRWVRKGATAVYLMDDSYGHIDYLLNVADEDRLPHLKRDPDVSDGKAKGRAESARHRP